MTVCDILVALLLSNLRHSTLVVEFPISNFQTLLRRTVGKWILKALEEIIPEIFKKSFKTSVLNLETVGWEVMLIHCFKKRSALRGWKPNSGKLIVDPYRKRYVNSFEIDESDIASANPSFSWLIWTMMITNRIKMAL